MEKRRRRKLTGVPELAYAYQYERNLCYRPWYARGSSPFGVWRHSKGARKFAKGQVRRARRQALSNSLLYAFTPMASEHMFGGWPDAPGVVSTRRKG